MFIANKNSKCIILFLLTTYCFSLALPAFKTSNLMTNEFWVGLGMLIAGTLYLPIGILQGHYGVLAVCSNYIFFYLVIKLLIQPNKIHYSLPILSILMSVLTLFSFFDIQPVYYTSSGSIVVWGYGAFFWFFSLNAMSLFILYQFFLKRTPKFLYVLLLFLFCSLSAISAHHYQDSQITDDYKRKIFSNDVWLLRYI